MIGASDHAINLITELNEAEAKEGIQEAGRKT